MELVNPGAYRMTLHRDPCFDGVHSNAPTRPPRVLAYTQAPTRSLAFNGAVVIAASSNHGFSFLNKDPPSGQSKDSPCRRVRTQLILTD